MSVSTKPPKKSFTLKEMTIKVPADTKMCVIASYNYKFKIPKNIDLNSDDVEEYWEKRGILYIQIKGMKEEEAIAVRPSSEPDYKFADRLMILPDDSDTEEEEEEEKQQEEEEE